MIEGVDPELVIRLLLNVSGWLLGLCMLLIVGIVGFFVAWNRRQDAAIARVNKVVTEYREAATYLRRLGEHNIPDAWKEADKAKDLLVQTLTKMVMGFCSKNACLDDEEPSK